MSIDPDGQLDWITERRADVRSSHETTIYIKSGQDKSGYRPDSMSVSESLLIDGNLSKFLQGHNIFGTRDLNTLVLETFRVICHRFADHLDGWSSVMRSEQRIADGDYLVKMIDINQLYDVGNDETVEQVLHALEFKARTRTGRAVNTKGSLYLQKNSRRWAIKLYNKYREVTAKGKTHRLPTHLLNCGLEDFVKGKLRIELRLMSLELKDRGLTYGRHLTQTTINQLFAEYLQRLNMNVQIKLKSEQAMKLPSNLLGTYELWKSGYDLKSVLSKPTFYRHRLQLLEHGIDITYPCDAEPESNVIPFVRLIELKPVANPDWAYEKGLIVQEAV